jgi:hypothetical protein
MTRFLASVRPLLSPAELTRTTSLVKDFQATDGPQLQAFLEERAKAHRNWLSDWWEDTAYLSFRMPLPVYSNPAYTLCDPEPHERVQERQASMLIHNLMQHRRLTQAGLVAVETSGGRPLCMEQYW